MLAQVQESFRMKSLQNMRDMPAGEPLLADEVLELHAARLLLLLRCCGTKSRDDGSYRIDGLTKMAKLDFFVRYPQFFGEVCKKMKKPMDDSANAIESAMVRFHYGPWDQRYYHILSYLEGRRLLLATSAPNNGIVLRLTPEGREISSRLLEDVAFADLKDQMGRVKSVLGKMSGNQLKKLIYDTFDDEIVQRRLGETIY